MNWGKKTKSGSLVEAKRKCSLLLPKGRGIIVRKTQKQAIVLKSTDSKASESPTGSCAPREGQMHGHVPCFAPRAWGEHSSSSLCLPATHVSYKLPSEDELERPWVCEFVFQRFQLCSFLVQSKLSNSVPSPNPVTFLQIFVCLQVFPTAICVFTHPTCGPKAAISPFI